MKILFAATILLFGISPSMSADWPSWRGPAFDGISSEKGLPTTWSDTNNLRWRVDMPGPGPGSPVVWGDKIFVTSADDGGALWLLALSTEGKELWRANLGEGNYDIRSGESNAAAPSPVTDGEHVWAFMGTGPLACFDMQGKAIWQKNLKSEYSDFNMFHGMASSPMLLGDKLILQMLHSNAQLLVALNGKTGEELWAHTRKSDAVFESRHAYTTPLLFKDGSKDLILCHGSDYLTAHDPYNGREIWRCGGFQTSDYNKLYRLVATPVVSGGLIIAPSAKNGPVIALKPGDAKGDITGKTPFQVWKREDNTPDVLSPIIHDGLVYLCRENGTLLCLEADTGKEVYLERAHMFRHRGSPVYADGKLYLSGADGTVTVVKAGREFNVLAKNEMGEQIAASPAVSNGTLYIRTYKALYAIAED